MARSAKHKHSTKIRVLIADDHPVVRAGLSQLIDNQPGLEVVGEAASTDQAITKAREMNPDVVLLDLSMPGPATLTAIADLLRSGPELRVLVLTMYEDLAHLRAVLEAGAVGYVGKSLAGTELLYAIRAVAQGRLYVNTALSVQATQSAPAGAAKNDLAKRLSKREMEILILVATGHTNRQIGERLEISVKSVETYRARLMDKLGTQSRAELVRYALERGLLSPDKLADLL
jgi:DNA-binding NarL/FixJ family response regulator